MVSPVVNFNFNEASEPGYLGRAEVVNGLMERFVLDDILGAEHHGTVMDSCRRMSAIFSGKVKGYTPMKGWEKDLPPILYRQFKIDPSMSPEDMLTTFFADLAEGLYKIVDSEEGEEMERRISKTTMAYAQALLGINGSYAWAAQP